VDEGIGVGLEAVVAVEAPLAGAAVGAAPVRAALDRLALSVGRLDELGGTRPSVCSIGSNQMLPSLDSNDETIECSPLAHFEQ
jgi:hypothetical protein